jgi:hypothetical protein
MGDIVSEDAGIMEAFDKYLQACDVRRTRMSDEAANQLSK